MAQENQNQEIDIRAWVMRILKNWYWFALSCVIFGGLGVLMYLSKTYEYTVDSQIMLNSNDKWRSPELSLTSLAEQLESNRTYVGEAFKHNTGMTFVEYITHRRINYVVETLKREPETNLHELFNYVGYRQRSTAYRNFQKITGMSPTEFLESIKR